MIKVFPKLRKVCQLSNGMCFTLWPVSLCGHNALTWKRCKPRRVWRRSHREALLQGTNHTGVNTRLPPKLRKKDPGVASLETNNYLGMAQGNATTLRTCSTTFVCADEQMHLQCWKTFQKCIVADAQIEGSWLSVHRQVKCENSVYLWSCHLLFFKK